MENKDKPIVIMGAGPVGSLLACYLSQRGFKVDLYERREDMRHYFNPLSPLIEI
jgi:2-polyprenyl-6-methoxyphenol hydroxylase-like FAD-dependent oxidoreductase